MSNLSNVTLVTSSDGRGVTRFVANRSATGNATGNATEKLLHRRRGFSSQLSQFFCMMSVPSLKFSKYCISYSDASEYTMKGVSSLRRAPRRARQTCRHAPVSWPWYISHRTSTGPRPAVNQVLGPVKTYTHQYKQAAPSQPLKRPLSQSLLV